MRAYQQQFVEHDAYMVSYPWHGLRVIMLGMLRMTTRNIKRVLRTRVIASEEAIFAIAKVKVTMDTLISL